jgi:hypothetical protein
LSPERIELELKRLHLFEFEDQNWYPRFMRDAGTTYLQFISRKMRLHEGMVPVIGELMERCGCTTVVDLCSGGAGPVLDIAESLHKRNGGFRVVLTDKFPNLPAFQAAQASHPEYIEFEADSVDALNVPPAFTGVRTVFNGFHHFSPELAKRILGNAVEAGRCVAIFELSERRLVNILSFPLILLFVLLAIPFLRPFRWSWLLFTYLIPIIPLTIAWDGVVSHLRAYSTDELHSLTSQYSETYVWRIVRSRWARIPFTVLTGMPKLFADVSR